MNSTIHERPGVYSSYDASSVVSASAAAKTIGAAAVATKGTANKVELITSYEEGKSVFGEDASGVYGMSTLLRFLFANGAGAVKAVAVGKDESEEKDYASAFAALSDEEDVGVMVCDSAAQSVHLLLKTAAEDASAARRERIAVIGGSEETVAQMVNRAKAVNSERVVLVGPDIGNLSAWDNDVQMELQAGIGHIVAVHVKDTKPGVFKNVPFGEGVVDFERCFETLKQSGYCGPYLIEMWSETAEDPAAEVAKARDWVKARMAKAGMVEAA